MPTFRVPLLWQMSGTVEVDAEDAEQAKTIALGSDTALPGAGQSEVVEGSWQVDPELPVEEM
jgi:hypothetical protein